MALQMRVVATATNVCAHVQPHELQQRSLVVQPAEHNVPHACVLRDKNIQARQLTAKVQQQTVLSRRGMVYTHATHTSFVVQ